MEWKSQIKSIFTFFVFSSSSNDGSVTTAPLMQPNIVSAELSLRFSCSSSRLNYDAALVVCVSLSRTHSSCQGIRSVMVLQEYL